MEHQNKQNLLQNSVKIPEKSLRGIVSKNLQLVGFGSASRVTPLHFLLFITYIPTVNCAWKMDGTKIFAHNEVCTRNWRHRSSGYSPRILTTIHWPMQRPQNFRDHHSGDKENGMADNTECLPGCDAHNQLFPHEPQLHPFSVWNIQHRTGHNNCVITEQKTNNSYKA